MNKIPSEQNLNFALHLLFIRFPVKTLLFGSFRFEGFERQKPCNFFLDWANSNRTMDLDSEGQTRSRKTFCVEPTYILELSQWKFSKLFFDFCRFLHENSFFRRNWEAAPRSTTVLDLILHSEFKSAVKFELSQSVRKLWAFLCWKIFFFLKIVFDLIKLHKSITILTKFVNDVDAND